MRLSGSHLFEILLTLLVGDLGRRWPIIGKLTPLHLRQHRFNLRKPDQHRSPEFSLRLLFRGQKLNKPRVQIKSHLGLLRDGFDDFR